MTESARDLVARLMSAFASGDVEVLDELIDVNYIQHNEIPDGLDGVKRTAKRLSRAFPDLQVTIHDVIVEGDKVVARLTMSGTHLGPFMGVQPTGTTVEFDSVDIWRVRNGKCVEHWDAVDRLGLMKQLGLLSTTQGNEDRAT
ncbi:MAG: ester cyclase [Ilumatobacteraceae bacterium]